MKIGIRADASVEMGTGHVVRCLTLADALAADGARVCFVCAQVPEALVSPIENHGHRLVSLAGPSGWEHDGHETAGCARDDDWDWLIVDHYALDARWERRLRAAGPRVLVIDDLANRPHDCDVLLDPNDDRPTRYAARVGPGARLLLGPRFALVRPEFAARRDGATRRRAGDLRRLLIFMGGTDPENETSKALRGVEHLQRVQFTIDVVIGASNPHRDEVAGLCARLPGATLHIETPRMPDLVTMADCAIGAGGGATWERCVLGLPALVTVVAENQGDIAARVAAAGAQRVLGWWRDLTPGAYADAIAGLGRDELVSMSRQAAALCDGDGVARVTACLAGASTPEYADA